MQFQADILGHQVVLAAHEELSAQGASWLAGLALGWWRDLADIAKLANSNDRIYPTMKASDREHRYAGWTMAIARARLSAEAGP
jgi:glycerol kinase